MLTSTYSTTCDFSETVQERQYMLNLVKRDLSKMGESDLPALINESKMSQVSRILTGDYNLKLARQDYFISNQDKVRANLLCDDGYVCMILYQHQ